jgi:hypothetical protein
VRLGIVSDTHDQFDRTQHAIELLRDAGAEVLAHCGDVTEPDLVYLFDGWRCYFVFGNCDADNVPQLRNAIAEVGGVCLDWGGEVSLGGKRVALTHGHLRGDVQRLLQAEPRYLLSGHSHIAGDWREGNCRRINPGAMVRARDYSVALLDLESDELKFLTVPR